MDWRVEPRGVSHDMVTQSTQKIELLAGAENGEQLP